MIAIKSVNGKAPKIEPDTFDVSLFDLYSDSTGRSAETGEMIAHLIRSDIYKIELTYTGSASQIREIREIYSLSKSRMSLSVKFLDLDEYVTKTMYTGDRTQNTLRYTKLGDGRFSLSFSLTEY